MMTMITNLGKIVIVIMMMMKTIMMIKTLQKLGAINLKQHSSIYE